MPDMPLRHRIVPIALLSFALPALGRDQAQTQPPSGQGSARDAKRRQTLLLRDFHPQSMLHTRVTTVERARFPVIDVHNHVNDARSADEHTPPDNVIQIMDATNVRTAVILTGSWGDKLQRVIDEMVKPHPGRFMVFTQIDWSRIDDPGFSGKMVEQMHDAVRRGARGLKVM